jgi:hypothetical protein
MNNEAIPNSQAVAYNWLAIILAVFVIELGLFYRRHSATATLCTIIHIFWTCIVNFVVVIAVTEVSKSFSGRLRPDFLARCNPAPEQVTGFTLYEEVSHSVLLVTWVICPLPLKQQQA